MRELAQRVFAAEFNEATHTFRESDDDRAPVYALLPTGAKANRVFVVGTLTETADVGDETEYWQGRIVGPTGTFFTYAGQYQPEAAGTLREIEPPAFVALVGKPRTYETDEGNINVSLRPEHLTVVDETTRNRWVTETATRTLERIRRFTDETNEYAQMAHEQYGESVETYRQAVIRAVESLDGPSRESSMGDDSAGRSEDSPAGGVETTTAESGDSIGDFEPDSFDS
jgi:RPA family protein